MNQNKLGLIFVLASSFCYALTGILSKVLVSSGLPPMLTLTLRTLFCTVFLGILVFAVKKEQCFPKKKDIKTFFLLGIVLFVYSAGYFLSLVYLDISIAVVLLYTYPAMLVIASVFAFKERLNKITVIALGLTFLGILFTIGIFDSSLENLSVTCLILVLSAAVGVAVYAILVKKLTSSYNGLVINLYCFIAASLLYCLIFPFCLPEEWPAATEYLSILVLALPYTLAFLFYAKGLQYLEAGKVGILASTEPVFSIAMAALFLGESIAPMQGVGILLVLTAIVLLELFPKKKEISDERDDQK